MMGETDTALAVSSAVVNQVYGGGLQFPYSRGDHGDGHLPRLPLTLRAMRILAASGHAHGLAMPIPAARAGNHEQRKPDRMPIQNSGISGSIGAAWLAVPLILNARPVCVVLLACVLPNAGWRPLPLWPQLHAPPDANGSLGAAQP